MEKNDRKLVRGESRLRKSFRRANTDSAVKRQSAAVPGGGGGGGSGGGDKGKGRAHDEADDMPGPPMTLHANHSTSALSQHSVSLVPDALDELPAWYNTELERTATATTQFRRRYPLHNPVGPRVYRNQHLIPSQRRQGSRPSSTFSPHFPPITASTGDHPGHAASMPGPSRTPSGSPLPTPSSSQVQVNQVGLPPKPRTRKISQGSPHDNVDMMDVSDPWGTNWHHQSPYDVSIRPDGDRSPTAAPGGESPETADLRPRLATVPHRHKSVTPSPLSQSTSAIQLAPPLVPGQPSMLRRLSKRRPENPFSITPPVAFGAKSAPTTPVTAAPGPAEPMPMLPDPPRSQSRTEERPKRRISLRPSASTTSVPMLAASPSMLSVATTKKEKRGSILARFARRFSIMRKPATVPAPLPEPRPSLEPSHSIIPNVTLTAEPEPMHPEADREEIADHEAGALPDTHMGDPPHVDQAALQEAFGDPVQDDAKRDSLSVLEASFSMGNLSITNPDAPTPDLASPLKLPDVTLPHHEEPAAARAVLEVTPVDQPSAPHPSSKELPPEPALSIMSPVLKDIPLPPMYDAPAPVQVFSPASFAAHMPSIPSPPELAYLALASPGMPSPDDLPTIPSPTSTYAPLPPPRDEYRASRSSLFVPPLPPTLATSPMSRASVLVNPPTTPYITPKSTPAPTEISARSPPARKPVVYTEVDLFAKASISRQRSNSPVKGPRDASPVKGPRASHDRVTSPVFPSGPVSPQLYATSREGSPPKFHDSDDFASADHARGASPTKVYRQPSRDTSPAKVHRQPSRETSPTKVYRQPSREGSPTKLNGYHDAEDVPKARRHREREGSPPVAVPAREKEPTVRRTETFRLVRSQSGGVVQSLANAETIVANGEHWEVVVEGVAAAPTPAKRSSRKDRSSRDLVDGHRRERERGASEEPELPSPGRRESHRREHTGEREERRSSKRDSKRRDRHRSEGDTEPPRAGAAVPTMRRSHDSDPRRSGAPEQPAAPATPEISHARERRPSTSARPTSEGAPEVDSALRARDAYDLERMWRGRSVALDAGVIMTPPTSPAPLPALQGATTHVFGGHSAGYTPSFGAAPAPTPQPNPPVLYKPAQPTAYTPAPAPALPARSTARPSGSRAKSSSPTKLSTHAHAPFYPDLSTPVERPLSNPLPPPPRESAYKTRTPRTPPVDAAAAHGHGSRDYWAKYAGLTAS